MADKRELILARLHAIGGTIPGIDFSLRNVLHISETKRPAFAMFDADEELVDQPMPSRKGGPLLVEMTPECYFLLGARPEDVGTQLNTLRAALIKAVLLDDTLLSYTANGFITYDNCMTTLAPGRATEGNMGLGFTFRYLIIPAEL